MFRYLFCSVLALFGLAVTCVAAVPSRPLEYSVTARKLSKVHQVDKNGFSQYNVDFKPGMFTCMKCDQG